MSEHKKNRILEIIDALHNDKVDLLVEYAEFIYARHGKIHGKQELKAMPVSSPSSAEIPRPIDIPRPEEEGVVKAIKRLTAAYPMLDKQKLLDKTSVYMTNHIMHGHEASDVIDELEQLFKDQYELLINPTKTPDSKNADQG